MSLTHVSTTVVVLGESAMALSMFDQMLFALVCGHTVVLGRLENAKSWTCEACGKVTDLSVSPAREALAKDWDTANQIDARAREGGERVVRAD
jgi:hypothetical protein